ncbi:hypothetical protein U9M48_020623 [Paspalum notatum var. saurae]|uniref:Bifunctional inhibitor/plant lipid transfer protein/seed storage helical domain-containing protein n=1 Tax=Paspalum notatum var. saurae TaxID=547442 RepID=A0AAQ3TH77_PASNO
MSPSTVYLAAGVVMLVLVSRSGGDPQEELDFRHHAHPMHHPPPPPPPPPSRPLPPPPPPPHRRRCNHSFVPEGTSLLSTDDSDCIPGPVAGEWCVAPLAALTPCTGFATRAEEEAAPAPGDDCCLGLTTFLARAAAAGRAGDNILGCVCPVIVGEVNTALPRPVDPVRLMRIPIACRVTLPAHLMHLCFG